MSHDHGYVPFVVIIIRSFSRPWLITGFVAKVVRPVSHVEQEMLCCSIFKFLSSVLWTIVCLFVLFLLTFVLSAP